MSRRRRTIALLVDSLSSEYTVLLRRAVERAAAQRKVDTLIFTGLRVGAPRAIEATQNRIYELISKDRIDGVIVVSSVLAHYCGKEGIETLCRRYVPLPVCSIGLSIEGVPSLVVDNLGGMNLGVSHLMDAHGRRRIALITGQVASPESVLRLEGYRKAHWERGIPIDERLILQGEFTMQSGAAATNHLIDSGVPFDALVAANDYMALAALDVFRRRAYRVPGDVLICGFDDIAVASCGRPTLTTLRQPMWWLGAQAVASILNQLDGDPVPACSVGSIELVKRESCGCGYQVGVSTYARAAYSNPRDALQKQRAQLEAKLRDTVSRPTDVGGQWVIELVDALDRELAGEPNQFLKCLEPLIEDAMREGASFDEFQRVVSTLRGTAQAGVTTSEQAEAIERLWHTARLMIGAAAIRIVGRDRVDIQHAASLLGRSGELLGASLSLPLLKDALVQSLPALGIRDASVSLYESGLGSPLRPLLVLRDASAVNIDDVSFSATMLAPDEAFPSQESGHRVVLPLTFDADSLGVAVLNSNCVANVYEVLRQQIGTSIKSAQLHRRVVSQMALRERLEQVRVTEEARVAADIQTSMAPASTLVKGLELAHFMLPAAEAGGDYCDILPDEAGAWLGIGDVTGHGLGAGLIMLMIQSMVAGLARSDPAMLPSRLVSLVNAALYDNVRHRLKRDEIATLTLLRYQGCGRFLHAGAHDPMIVLRAKTGLCEIITPLGFWIGAMPSVEAVTRDGELVLEEGDLLVLYTDGVTEARNAQTEQFGLERLKSIVTANAVHPVAIIVERVVSAVKNWCSSFDDDITLLIARYRADKESA